MEILFSDIFLFLNKKFSSFSLLHPLFLRFELSKMRSLVLIFIFVILQALFLQGPGLAFSNIKYDIECRFLEDQGRLQCQERLSFDSQEGLDEIHLHFYPHHRFSRDEIDSYKRYLGYFSVSALDEQDLSTQAGGIDYIRVGGRPAFYEFRGDDETILVVRSRITGSTELEIGFWVEVPRRIGRFGRWSGLYSLYRFYPILDVEDNGVFKDYPDLIVHQPYISESADYRMRLFLPRGYSVAFSGVITRQESSPEGLKYTIESDKEIRDFYLAFSKKYRVYRREYKGVEIKVFYLEGRRDSAEEIAGFVRDGLRFYSRVIAPYPYKQISVVPVGLGYGGNETSNVIMLDSRVYDIPKFLSRYKEFLVVHELGHQWWFNVVGSDEFTQTWMDEGINSFFVQEYLREKYGPDPEILHIPWFLRPILPNISFSYSAIYRWHYLVNRGINPPVIGEIGRFKEPSTVFAIAYGKGERALEILKKVCGRDKLYKALRDYFDAYKWKIGHLSDLKGLLAKECGKASLEVLDFYLSGKKTDLSWQVDGRRLRPKVRWDRPQQDVKIYYKGASGEANEVVVQDLEGFSLPVSEVREAFIDTDDSALEVDEGNNIYPFYKGIDYDLGIYRSGLHDFPVFNRTRTLRLGMDGGNYGIGPRLSYVDPYAELRLFTGLYWGLSEGSRTYRAGFRKSALFSTWTELGANYVYEDIYERGIVHKKILGYLKFDLGLPPPNPLKEGDNLKLYLASEWKAGMPSLIYYDEQHFSYLGMELSKELKEGLRIETAVEHGDRFLGGEEDFNRFKASVEDRVELKDCYALISVRLGISDRDGDMFYLGGRDGLSAFSDYEIPSANFAMLGLELGSKSWPVPVDWKRNGLLDIDSARVFGGFDIARNWVSSIDDGSIFSQVRAGLEFSVGLLSNVSKIRLRLELARSLRRDRQTRLNLLFKL